MEGTPQIFQTSLNAVHLFHGLHHGPQLFIRQSLQGIVQYFIYLLRPEFLRQLRCTNLYQQLNILLILIHPGKAEQVFIYHRLVFALCVGKRNILSQDFFHVLFRVWNFRGTHLLIQLQIVTDSPSVQQNEAPETHGLTFLRPLPDADGPVLVGLRLAKLQEQIAGGLFFFAVSEEIIFHSPVAGAERIQSSRRPVPVQDKRDEALGRNGFSCAILSSEQNLPVAQIEGLFIVQPEVDESHAIHFPTVMHLLHPPLSLF